MDQRDIDALDTKINILFDGIRRVIEEGAPRKVADPYYPYDASLKPHRGDRCPHKAYTWQSCDACTILYLASVLKDAG